MNPGQLTEVEERTRDSSLERNEPGSSSLERKEPGSSSLEFWSMCMFVLPQNVAGQGAVLGQAFSPRRVFAKNVEISCVLVSRSWLILTCNPLAYQAMEPVWGRWAAQRQIIYGKGGLCL